MKLIIKPVETSPDVVELSFSERVDGVSIVAKSKEACHTLLKIRNDGVIELTKGVVDRLGFSLDSKGCVVVC
jgi:hypothetical protein